MRLTLLILGATVIWFFGVAITLKIYAKTTKWWKEEVVAVILQRKSDFRDGETIFALIMMFLLWPLFLVALLVGIFSILLFGAFVFMFRFILEDQPFQKLKAIKPAVVRWNIRRNKKNLIARIVKETGE